MNVKRLREFLSVLPDEAEVSCECYEDDLLLITLGKQSVLLDLDEYSNEHFVFDDDRVVGFSFPPPKLERVSVITNLPPLTDEQRVEWERLEQEYRDLPKPVSASKEEMFKLIEQQVYAVSPMVKSDD